MNDYNCQHPDHVDGKSCEDHCVGCSKHCRCCMGELVVPATGMGGTYCIGSDRYAVTVVRLQGTTIVWTRWDKHKRTDHNGQSEAQRYIHVPNPNGHLQKFTRRRDGTWREAGSRCGYLHLGARDTYQDPSF